MARVACDTRIVVTCDTDDTGLGDSATSSDILHHTHTTMQQ